MFMLRAQHALGDIRWSCDVIKPAKCRPQIQDVDGIDSNSYFEGSGLLLGADSDNHKTHLVTPTWLEEGLIDGGTEGVI